MFCCQCDGVSTILFSFMLPTGCIDFFWCDGLFMSWDLFCVCMSFRRYAGF